MGVPALAEAHKPEPPPIGTVPCGYGIVERILLVYEEAQRRRPGRQSVPVEAVMKAAGITRRCVENCQQKLEEESVFPLLEKCSESSAVVKTLRAQHDEARRLTGCIFALCKGAARKDMDNELALSQKLLQFVQLYRRHMALEESLLSRKLAEGLGERPIKGADDLASADCGDGVLVELESLEKELGVLLGSLEAR